MNSPKPPVSEEVKEARRQAFRRRVEAMKARLKDVPPRNPGSKES